MLDAGLVHDAYRAGVRYARCRMVEVTVCVAHRGEITARQIDLVCRLRLE